MLEINPDTVEVVTVDSNRDLYGLGNANLLKQDCISVSGARKITPESKKWLKEVLNKVRVPIISGLALGTDGIAHKIALKNDVPTIAVLPSGFKKITPRSHQKLAERIVENGGLLLSEYPALKKANPHSYVERNEIIAKLGKYLVVPQFEYKSGTRYTVDYAMDNNKTIFIQESDYTGNQFIIKDKSYKTVII